MPLIEKDRTKNYALPDTDNYDQMGHVLAWKLSTTLCSKCHPTTPPCFFPSDFSLNTGRRHTHAIPTIAVNCTALEFYHDYHKYHDQLPQKQHTNEMRLQIPGLEQRNLQMKRVYSETPLLHTDDDTSFSFSFRALWSSGISKIRERYRGHPSSEWPGPISERLITSAFDDFNLSKRSSAAPLHCPEVTARCGSLIDNTIGAEGDWRTQDLPTIGFKEWIRKMRCVRERAKESESGLNIQGIRWRNASSREIDRMTTECGKITDLVAKELDQPATNDEIVSDSFREWQF